MDEPTVQRLGKYEIIGEVGSGGMGVVYKAYQPSLNRYVAIKVLPKNLSREAQFVERFRREAQAAAKLSNPNIVPIHDVGRDGDVHYLVMEFIDGPSLATKLETAGALPLEDALSIFNQVGAALDYAHSHKIVHRDIKPSNILLSRDGRAMLCDFGIARAADDSDLTIGTLGTAEYMSPEQALGRRDLDGRADLYSLTVVLFKMLTGHGAFQADTPLSMMQKHLHETPLPPSHFRADLPKAFDAVIMRGLEKDRDRRYANAAQMARELEQIIHPQKEPDGHETQNTELAWGEFMDRMRSQPWAWALAALGLVLLAVSLAGLLRGCGQGGDATPTPGVATSIPTRVATAVPATATSEPVNSPTPAATRRPTLAHTRPPQKALVPSATISPEEPGAKFQKVSIQSLSYSGGMLRLTGTVRMPYDRYPDQWWQVRWVGDEVVGGLGLKVTDQRIDWHPVTGDYRYEDADGVLAEWEPSPNTHCRVHIVIVTTAGQASDRFYATFDLQPILPGCLSP